MEWFHIHFFSVSKKMKNHYLYYLQSPPLHYYILKKFQSNIDDDLLRAHMLKTMTVLVFIRRQHHRLSFKSEMGSTLINRTTNPYPLIILYQKWYDYWDFFLWKCINIWSSDMLYTNSMSIFFHFHVEWKPICICKHIT